MRLQTLLSVALCALGVASSGWKPIPPPRGLYLSKASHDSPHHFKHHSIPEDYRAGGSSADSSDALSTSEIFFNSPTHSYKSFSSDINHRPHDLENIFTKDLPKSYKPILSSYDEGKRSPFSYHNFAYRRKPIKTGFFDKPGVAVLGDDLTHSKYPFLENEIRPQSGYLGHHEDRQCSLYKVAFRQDLYFQYIQYKVVVPDMKEFTLCMWNKFSNHTNDHPLFSYAVRNQPKAIAVWVSTTDRSNYFNMAINGHSIFRLNYPIRLNRWYHTCTSWNGKSGEWQVWVNAERIGRGFHNLLVGHVIKGGGIAITGQEQKQLGGGFQEGPDAPKGSGGFLGEVTMVQLYKVALTAGKAYNDHRHHHSLKTSTTTELPPPPPQPEMPTTDHPFLENGQLKRKIPVFELAESIKPKIPEQTSALGDTTLQLASLDPNLNLFGNHFHNPFLPGLDASVLTPYMMHFPDHNLFKRNNEKTEDTRSKRNGDNSEGNEGVNTEMKIKFVPTPQQVHVDKVRFAEGGLTRAAESEEDSEDLRPKRESDDEEEHSEDETRQKRQLTLFEEDDKVESSRPKREFVLVDEDKKEPEEDTNREGRRLRRPTRQNSYGVYGMRSVRPRARRPIPAMRKEESEGLSEAESEHDPAKRQVFLGDFGFGQLLKPKEPALIAYRPPTPDTESNTPEDDGGPRDPMEPAEGEVRRIMSVCSGCDADPFRKVAVISWRSAPKKIYSGAVFLKARPECRRF